MHTRIDIKNMKDILLSLYTHLHTYQKNRPLKTLKKAAKCLVPGHGINEQVYLRYPDK